MKSALLSLGVILLLIAGTGLTILTNTGVLRLSKSYIVQRSAEQPPPPDVVVFVNVDVVPMDSEQILSEQTVVVRQGRITQVGAVDDVQIPEGAQLVDGTGQYLMPGLVDMHVHIQFKNDLLLFVANGVTSVRNMWGSNSKMRLVAVPNHLALREQIEQGTLLGPTIFTAGPVMEGSPVFHPVADALDSHEAAREAVALQKAQGYDLVKVYDHLSPGVYQAILAAAREHELPVVGHVPLAVSLDDALAGGQHTIEHLSGYVDPDTVEFIIPEGQLDEYALKTREAGVWNVVTLTVYPASKETPEGMERLQNQPGMVYLSPLWKLLTPIFYKQTAESHTYAGADYPQRIAALNRRMVQALHKADAGILLGTDAWQGYHIPGFSIHDELEMLVEAGLTPYEAFTAGTRNAALALGQPDEFGTVTPGKRADLLLLTANPLEDVSAVRERAGVMVRGRWFTEAELQEMLEELTESYRPRWFDRLWPLGLVAAAAILVVRRLHRRNRQP